MDRNNAGRVARNLTRSLAVIAAATLAAAACSHPTSEPAAPSQSATTRAANPCAPGSPCAPGMKKKAAQNPCAPGSGASNPCGMH